MNDCTVNVLGTPYRIKKMAYDAEPAFKKRSIDGYCNGFEHIIVYCDLDTDKRWEEETPETRRICEKETIRHELVHAFLNESGLKESTGVSNNGWATFEEMVDWIALQAPKMYALFKELDLLEEVNGK